LHQFHWTVACHILRYLKKAPSKRLFYRPSFNLDIVRILVLIRQASDPIDRHFTMIIALLMETIW